MEMVQKRIPVVLIGLSVIAALLVGQLLSFQFRLNPSISVFEQNTASGNVITERIAANRGQIYDRDGVVLAVNAFEYRVGISPALISPNQRQEVAVQIAAILNLDENEIFRKLQPDINNIFPEYVPLAGPIDDQTARALEDLDLNGIIIEPVALRSYPQGALTAQIIGFVNYSEQGFYGVEGRYDDQLAGTAREVVSSSGIFNVEEVPDARDGQSLVLTIDRDIQNAVQQVLTESLATYGAEGGTIIVMNPRTGEILAMQSTPILDPGEFPQADPDTGVIPSFNGVVSSQYEPGSTIKVISAAITLQANIPGLDLGWSYNNTGCFLAAGVSICDWDDFAKGNVNFTRCIVDSLNTCTATWYMLLGRNNVYPYLEKFGFGRPTGIDLEGEAAGTLVLPTDPTWSEANFLNISYGQGIATTPLQLLVAVNSIAHDGVMMQPHIVRRRIDGNQEYEVLPNPLERTVSEEVADTVTDLMVQTLVGDSLDGVAGLPGYTIAGKTGTSQIPVNGVYSDTESWASFVGFLPADDPIVSVLIILERPDSQYYYGSQSAAPTFRKLVERLVVLLDIPPDEVRYQIQQAGGDPFARR